MADSDEDRTKTCRDCGASKLLDEFPRQKGGRLGRHPLCKPCRAAQERRRYKRDRESILARSRVDPKRKRRVRWRALERKYGLSEVDFSRLSAEQGDRCAICERPTSLVVDHDHATGEVRGLLCRNCNFALGELKDDPDRAEAASRYLEGNR